MSKSIFVGLSCWALLLAFYGVFQGAQAGQAGGLTLEEALASGECDDGDALCLEELMAASADSDSRDGRSKDDGKSKDDKGSKDDDKSGDDKDSKDDGKSKDDKGSKDDGKSKGTTTVQRTTASLKTTTVQRTTTSLKTTRAQRTTINPGTTKTQRMTSLPMTRTRKMMTRRTTRVPTMTRRPAAGRCPQYPLATDKAPNSTTSQRCRLR